MRNLLTISMVSTVGACLALGVVAFGAVTPELSVPMYALAGVAILLWVAKLLFSDFASWKKSPMHWPVLAFLVYAVVRYFTSPIRYDSRLELFNLWLCGLIYFLAASNIYRSRDRAILLNVLIAIGILQSLYSIWQFATRTEMVLFLQRPQAYFSRGSGTYICPNHLAGFLGMIMGLVLGNLALRKISQTDVQRSTLTKIWWAYAAIMMMAGSITTLSRAGWIATAVGVLLVLLWGDWGERSMWPRITVAVLSVTLLVFIAYKIQPARDHISLTFRTTSEAEAMRLKDPSLGGRTLLWQTAWQIFCSHPVFGTGAGTWQWLHLKYRNPQIQTRSEYAHNDILNLASDYGSIGVLIALAALIRFYRQAIFVAKTDPSSERQSFAVGGVIAVTIILVHSWFDFNLHVPANALLLAIIMGLTAGMEDDSRRFRRVEMKRIPRLALAGGLMAVLLIGAWSFGRTALASRYTALGIDAKEVLDWSKATNYFHRAIAVDSGYPEPHNRLGDTFLTQSEWRLGPARDAERKALAREAIQCYEKSLALNQYQSEVFLRMARAQEIVGQDSQALKAYEQAVTVDPNNAFNFLRIGLYYRRVALQFATSDFTNLTALVEPLRRQSDPVSRFLWERFSEPARRVLSDANSTSEQLQSALAGELNEILRGDPIFDAQRFAAVPLSEQIRKLLAQDAEGDKQMLCNRILIEESFPQAISKNRRIGDTKKAVEAFRRSADLSGAADRIAWFNLGEVRSWL